MKGSNPGLLAVAAAIAFTGALWAGVPLEALAPVLIVLACPLMMVVMMKGMHATSDKSGSEREDGGGSRRQHTQR